MPPHPITLRSFGKGWWIDLKIITKRVYAALIDAFLFGTCWTLFSNIIFENMDPPAKSFNIVLFIAYFFKDCIFKNASIGKKILGLRIYGLNWKPIGVFEMVKRTVFMLSAGYLMFLKIKFLGSKSDMMEFFDWERDQLKTVVIDEKIFKQFSEEANLLPGNYADNMTNLYHAYLRRIYSE